MKTLLLATSLILINWVVAQSPFQTYCNQAYNLYPHVPKGVLEAISFTQTRMQYLTSSEMESCSGLPKSYGFFGLVENGKNYFHENMKWVAQQSGYSVNQIKNNPQIEVLALAKTIQQEIQALNGQPLGVSLKNIFQELSYLSDSGKVNQYARDAELYELFKFLNDDDNSIQYQFPNYNFDMPALFGPTNFAILSSSKVILTETGIHTPNGVSYEVLPTNNFVKSTEYGPAIWNAAPTCNFSSRNGTAISAITIHTIQGSYAGAISWSQNCNSSVSFHYVVRSSDGQITQMVLEANKGWHVGSENPYTIGYEHEGYVSQTGWYTTAMYNASAALTRDICNSGYGINPLRTYFGAATSGSNVLGSCTKIKGHQHYPNQTHTDPGINWDWKLYYRLVNNSPTQTTLTTATGTFYDTGGSAGPYSNDQRYLILIQPSGATNITLNFTSFNTEANWDYLFIYDGSTSSAPLIGTYTGTNSPGTITSTGGALLIEFRSDCATTASGWAANWTSTNTPSGPSDMIAPSTSINTPNNWKTQDFTATFTDADNAGGSGLEKSFYQVIDFDGTDWRANSNSGFFSDNFILPTMHPEWTSSTGTWAVSNGMLAQTDEANSNTNVYASINHSLSNRYLYQWAGSISGSGTNRRAGLHYFCDNPTLSNRGNSYFVFFRLDDDKVQLYKVINDVFTLQDEVSFNLNANQWYDFKVAYDRITGKHQVYIDNTLVQTWIDPAPLSSGNYVSFRSGNCHYAIDNVKIYRTRYPSVSVTVGAGMNLRYQNTNSATQAGRIKSIVQDVAGNLSSIAQEDVMVDWTEPSAVLTVNDGVSADISSTTSTSTLEANWTTSTDPHSDVARYWYAIGTSPGSTNIQGWTDNFWNTSVSVNGLTLSTGTTYYFSVKAENGAGLFSTITSSNGQIVQAPTDPPVANFFVQNNYMCISDSISFTNTSTDATSFSWIAAGAINPTSTAVNPSFQFPATGSYTVTLIASGPTTSDTLEQTLSVQVSPLITADFSINSDTLYFPNPILTCTNNSSNANGYTWNFGDGSESQDLNPWHQFTQAGTFTVRLVAVNDACPQDTSLQTVTVINTLNIENLGTQVIGLFPNPATDQIRILYPANIVRIEITDLNGKQILSKPVSGTSSEINTQDWSAGAYLVNLFSADKAESQMQFIKN